MTFDSISEGAAAPVIAALGGKRCNTFAPFLSTTYTDAEGEVLRGEPDYAVFRNRRSRSPIFVEWKFGKLNRHYTRSSSHAALQDAYYGPAKSHSFLSNHFWTNGYGSGKSTCLAHSFNHSLFKVLALQAEHGWRNYIVCFKANPKPEDAQRYCEAGLIWCTLKTLPQLLIRIELEDSGFPISFIHRAQKFSYEVEWDDGTATTDEIRPRFLAAVAADKAAQAAVQAQAAADWEAGLRPF
jgi:hypothetical protein